MNAKRAGILFCAIVLVSTVIELLLTFTPLAEYMGLLGTLAASELIMIVPCLIAFCSFPLRRAFSCAGAALHFVYLVIVAGGHLL